MRDLWQLKEEWRKVRPVRPQNAVPPESDGEIGAEAVRMTRPGRFEWRHPGWLVLGATILLTLIGLHAITISRGLEHELLNSLAKKQLVFAIAGVIGAFVVMIPHYRWAAHLAWPAAAATVALLVFVLIPFVPEAIVRPRNGARRWISMGFTDFQPSELAKIVFVIVVAQALERTRKHREYRGLVVIGLAALVPIGLILIEPDLGTSLLFVPTLLAMLVAAGARLKHLILTGLAGASLGIAIIVVSLVFAEQDKYPLLRPHQVVRIQAVLDEVRGDDRHRDERGFQGTQAKILLGSGGVSGHGELRSRALVSFSALPERHNDMIFPVVVNRFGMLGALAVLALYGVWVIGACAVAVMCKDGFGRLVVIGLASMIATQASINMGMTMGLFPITGMTLPFVSYGGSSLLMGYLMVGVIMSVAIRRPPLLWKESFDFDDASR